MNYRVSAFLVTLAMQRGVYAQSAGNSTSSVRCPHGTEFTGNEIVPCCWPGQRVSSRPPQCVGIPRCPSGARRIRNFCEPPTAVFDGPPFTCPPLTVPISASVFRPSWIPPSIRNRYVVSSVELSAFCADRTEVTLASYRECVRVGVCDPPATHGQCESANTGDEANPVVCVYWRQADSYCRWVGGRLPTMSLQPTRYGGAARERIAVVPHR
jgi:hypothetical protein